MEIMRSNTILKKLMPYLLLLPAFILICIFKINPIIQTVVKSFINNGEFVTKTYITLFNDPQFWNSLKVTLKLNIIMIPLQIFISFWLAIIVNLSFKGITVFRTIYYLPFTTSLTVATLIWNLMLNYNSGIVNSVLSVLGIGPQGFFIDKRQALLCIVLVATWKGCGYWMMFLLAGLKNIDASIYESAKIDGAGFFTTVSRITIPLLKKVLLFVLVANTTANMLLFAPVQLITEGGPQGSTNVLMYEAYKSAFKYANQPRSAALVTILLLIIIGICIVQFKFLDEKEESVA